MLEGFQPLAFLFEVIYEFIGSVFLATFINVMYKELSFEILFPIILIIPYALAWRVSRAHLNPAITLAHLLRRDVKFNIIQFFGYVAAQVLGHW
jgi:glycerol uptake facilitator-like aquaporin